jgi:hypothetical protein
MQLFSMWKRSGFTPQGDVAGDALGQRSQLSGEVRVPSRSNTFFHVSATEQRALRV